MLLDSSVCIHFLRSGARAARDSLTRLPLGEIVLSTIVIAELEAGIRFDLFARQRLDFEDLVYTSRVAPFDEAAARVAGAVDAELRRKGLGIDFADCCIAAHAIALERPLATLNTRHFSRVRGLTLIDWNAVP